MGAVRRRLCNTIKNYHHPFPLRLPESGAVVLREYAADDERESTEWLLHEHFEKAARTYLTDALGSTLSLTQLADSPARSACGSASFGLVNSAGTIAGSYTYEPFGKATASGTVMTPFQFTGREDDGLYYYRARYYQPRYQRFISQDPIDFGGGDSNLYSYVWNRPIVLIDPIGNWVTC